MSQKDRGYFLFNYNEELVDEALKRILATQAEICTCPRCMGDMAAFVLNKMQPRYVSTTKGEVFSSLEEMDKQKRADLIAIIMQAIEKVKKNPRHEVEDDKK